MDLTQAVDSLSNGQKTCLRLVSRGMSSKEIALETGLAPATVDTYVKAAVARLGATNRRDAARMLAAAELPHKSGSPPEALVPAPTADQDRFVAERWPGAAALLPPPLGGRINDLSAAARTYAVLRVAAFSAATVIAIALLIAGALRTFR